MNLSYVYVLTNSIWRQNFAPRRKRRGSGAVAKSGIVCGHNARDRGARCAYRPIYFGRKISGVGATQFDFTTPEFANVCWRWGEEMKWCELLQLI
jgi:hypothetical protein